jgi:hypothetical protein
MSNNLNWHSFPENEPERYDLNLVVTEDFKLVKKPLSWTDNGWNIGLSDNKYEYPVKYFISLKELPLPLKIKE